MDKTTRVNKFPTLNVLFGRVFESNLSVVEYFKNS